MNPSLRLTLCSAIILVSASYALLIAQDRRLAEAVALGYIAVILTLFVIVNVWKRDD